MCVWGGGQYPGKDWDQVADAVGERGEGVVMNWGGGGKEGGCRVILWPPTWWAFLMGAQGGT